MERTRLLLVASLICCALIVAPISAYVSVDNMYDLRSRISTPTYSSGYSNSYDYSLYNNIPDVRKYVASQYGLNPFYLSDSSYAGAHTEYSKTLDVICLPGVDESFVRQSLQLVNPFYKFNFITDDPSRYKVSSKTGLFESTHLGTVVISQKNGECAHCGCGTTGQCCPVSLYIDNKYPVTPEAFANLVEMECDHLLGPVSPDGTDTHQYTSEEVTAAYTESSKEWGTVRVTQFRGTEVNSWIVYV